MRCADEDPADVVGDGLATVQRDDVERQVGRREDPTRGVHRRIIDVEPVDLQANVRERLAELGREQPVGVADRPSRIPACASRNAPPQNDTIRAPDSLAALRLPSRSSLRRDSGSEIPGTITVSTSRRVPRGASSPRGSTWRRSSPPSTTSYGESSATPMMSAMGRTGGPNTACVTRSSRGTLSGTTTTPITCLARPRDVAGPLTVGTDCSSLGHEWVRIRGDPGR